MNIRAPLVIVLIHLATTCCAASDDGVYSFKGSFDAVSGTLEVSLESREESIDLKVERSADDAFQIFLDVQNLHSLFFELTTQINGVFRVVRDNAGENRLSGEFHSQHTVFNGLSGPEMTAELFIHQGSITLTRLEWGGLIGMGTLGLNLPFPIDVRATLYETEITDVLQWFAGQDKVWSGNGVISGDIVLSGYLQKILVSANLLSQNGYIEDLAYDLLKLNVQGVYPIIDLTGSTVTKTNGFSVGLAGLIDLSNRTHMASQMKAVKRIPLVQDNDSRSEWVLKKVQDPDGAGKMQTSLFLKQNKPNSLSGQDDSSLLGVEKKIGF